jgi:hypothetical protein
MAPFAGLKVRALVLAAAVLTLLACSPPTPGQSPDQAGANSTKPPRGAETPAARSARSQFTKDELLNARRLFRVEVIGFDTSRSDQTDYLKLRVTNNSTLVIPCLTVVTRRYQGREEVGWSRKPALPVADLKPGETKDYDYYPLGHLTVVHVDRLAVVVEPDIAPADEQYFEELSYAVRDGNQGRRRQD